MGRLEEEGRQYTNYFFLWEGLPHFYKQEEYN
jgi:hypothetical protein